MIRDFLGRRITPKQAAALLIVDSLASVYDLWPEHVVKTGAMTEREVELVGEQIKKLDERILKLLEPSLPEGP